MLIDETGKRYGRLVVLQRDNSPTKQTDVIWVCACDCGERRSVRGSSLRKGLTNSCGCLKPYTSGISHGLYWHSAYSSWASMMKRCYAETCSAYEQYGGRGITVCERWHSPKNFIEDMGERPSGRTIDRIDNDGNYEPNNCRWATRSEQNLNKRNSLRVVVGGIAMNTKEVTEKYGVPYQLLIRRLKRGWSGDNAAKTPSR